MTQPSVETLMQYAGLWIAHSGTEVLAYGNDPAVVAQKLRELGLKGTIWRVPTKGESDILW